MLPSNSQKRLSLPAGSSLSDLATHVNDGTILPCTREGTLMSAICTTAQHSARPPDQQCTQPDRQPLSRGGFAERSALDSTVSVARAPCRQQIRSSDSMSEEASVLNLTRKLSSCMAQMTDRLSSCMPSWASAASVTALHAWHSRWKRHLWPRKKVLALGGQLAAPPANSALSAAECQAWPMCTCQVEQSGFRRENPGGWSAAVLLDSPLETRRTSAVMLPCHRARPVRRALHEQSRAGPGAERVHGRAASG